MQPVCVVVTSTAPPSIRWHCPSCDHSVFDCSQRFRMNSNGKLVDIWLIYRCGQCSATKNLTVVERRPVAKVPAALFRAATENDPVIARAMARDGALVKAAGARFARGDAYEIEPVPHRCGPVELVFAEPLLVRLDEVVAHAVGLPRRRVAELMATGDLCVHPSQQRIDKLRLWSSARIAAAPLRPFPASVSRQPRL